MADRLKVVYRATASLAPYARNARTHSEAQVAQIAASIKEFGFTNPVLIDPDGTIIAGHGRVLAALKLGLDTVPCIVLGHLTEAQRRAYVLADNRIALNSGWDADMLRLEAADLSRMGVDLAALGFGKTELAKMAAEPVDSAPKLGGLAYKVVVDCDDEAQQTELLDRFEAEGLTCRALIS